MTEIRSTIISLFMAGNSNGEIFRILKTQNVGRRLIHRTIQRFKGTGTVQDRPRTRRPRIIRTRNLKEKLRKIIVRNPRRSIRKMAQDFQISDRSLRRVIHDDLVLKALRRKMVHMLTTAMQQKRVDRSRALLSCATPVFNNILFSDEKLLRSSKLPTPKKTESFHPGLKTSPKS